MAGLLPEYLELIQKVAEAQGVVRYVFEYVTGPEKGGYLGVITAITLKDKNGDRELNLILKAAQTNKDVRNRRPILEAFERELEFYNVVLPEFLRFQITHCLKDPFTGVARIFGSSFQDGKEAILMEHLGSNGYKLRKRLEPLDFDHMALVFEEYAKFHVISLALRHKYPEKFSDLTKNMRRNFLEQREAKNPDHYRYLMKVVLAMGRKAVEGNSKAQEAHRKFEEILPDFWKGSKKHPEHDIVVVSHGDCHPNNIMFKYDTVEAPKPQKVCLIDWQLSTTESPIHDISFLLFACGSKEVLQRAFDLFRIYHDVITRNLTEFNCDPMKVFSYHTFMDHWKKHFLHGLYRAQMTLKLTLMTEQEMSELDETSSVLDTLKKKFSSDSIFAQRMRDLFETVGEKWL